MPSGLLSTRGGVSQPISTFALPDRVAGNVKVQASAGALVDDFVLDLMGRDGSVAQVTRHACSVAGIYSYRQHDRQSTVIDALDHARE